MSFPRSSTVVDKMGLKYTEKRSLRRLKQFNQYKDANWHGFRCLSFYIINLYKIRAFIYEYKQKKTVVDMEVDSEAFLLEDITNDDKYTELKEPEKS